MFIELRSAVGTVEIRQQVKLAADVPAPSSGRTDTLRYVRTQVITQYDDDYSCLICIRQRHDVQDDSTL